MAKREFEVISNDAEDRPDNSLATNMLVLGLKTLSQRAIAAIADLFMLASLGSAFVLWYLTPKPDVYQIVSLTIYGVLVLAANYIVRSRRA